MYKFIFYKICRLTSIILLSWKALFQLSIRLAIYTRLALISADYSVSYVNSYIVLNIITLRNY